MCTYQKENGKAPCCTHQCEGCVWNDVYDEEPVKNDCPICNLKIGEKIMQSPFAPSLCWLETSRTENGYIQMKFGYGDDFEHIFYYPKYCPECGRKIEKVMHGGVD